MASNSSENTAPTKLCGNCKKDVLTGNFDMHTVHCHRFMKYCDYCDQSFSKNDWDRHVDENHGEIACKDCGKSIEKKFIEKHLKSECRFRLETCEYCGLSLPWCRFSEHSNFCGSRTEMCPSCSKYIKLRDLDNHFCQAASTPSNGENFFEGRNFFDDVQEVPMFVARSCDYCNKSERSLGMSLGEHKDVCPEQPVSCKYCPDKVPMLFLESHEAVCPGMTVVCPTCHENVRFEQVERHSESCRNLDVEMPSTRQFLDLNRDQQSTGTALKDFGGLKIKDGKVRIPCEFCNNLFSVDMLIQHESACDLAGLTDTSDPRLRE